MVWKLPALNRSHYLGFCLILICGMAQVSYMSWEAGTCEVTAVSFENGPENIIFIADPHLRPENIEHTREVIRQINSLKPAVVLIGGDMTYGRDDNLSLQAVWSGIDAPVYAILGNHDYRTGIRGGGIEGKYNWLSEVVMRTRGEDTSFLYHEYPDLGNAGAIETVLEENGVVVLRNEYVVLPGNGTPVILVGVDDVWAGMADPPEIPETGAFVIYMVHEPFYRPEWNADLILAGHTHGGQYNVAVPQVADSLGVIDISGFCDKDGIPMFVTRGIGTSDTASEYRFLASPEIVVINPDPSVIPPGTHVLSV